jgi:hypothetical protein
MLQHGLHFIGGVKTPSRHFPMAYCTEFFKDEANLRGQHCTLQSDVSWGGGATATIFAVSWKHKKIIFFFCYTWYTTLQGSPHLRLRHRRPSEGEAGHTIREHLEVAGQPLSRSIFKDFPRLTDVHDHYRQGSLGMEMYWPTKQWWHRIFSTIFGDDLHRLLSGLLSMTSKWHTPTAWHPRLGSMISCVMSLSIWS